MYNLLGMKANLETVILLSCPFLDRSRMVDRVSLKRAYQRYLHAIQPDVPFPTDEAVCFVTDDYLVDALISFYRVDSSLNDLQQQEVISRTRTHPSSAARARSLRQFFETAREEHHEPWELFSLTVNFVFCSDSIVARGGSTDSAIGVIWVSDPSSLDARDTFELLFHELTHTLMFLDERRHPHYLDYELLAAQENYAYSAILCRKRPLDKVLHSLVVSTEIILLRERMLRCRGSSRAHPASSVMVSNGLATIASMRSMPRVKEILEPRGFDLIDRCESALETVAHGVTPERCLRSVRA